MLSKLHEFGMYCQKAHKYNQFRLGNDTLRLLVV